MEKVLKTVCVLSAMLLAVLVADDKIKLGVDYTPYMSTSEGFAELCKGNGIVQGNFSYHLLTKADVTKEKLLGELRKFHVITVRPFGEGADRLGKDAEGKVAATVGEALAEYAREGGSVIIAPRLSRYTNTKDTVFWNKVFSPFGMSVDNNHGIAGTEYVRLEEKPAGFNYFFKSSSIEAHEATSGVRNLWFPVNSYSFFPGTPRVEYGKEWKPLVFADEGSGVWECMESARVRFDGKNRIEPVDGKLPLAAIREFGHGHVACIQADPIYLGMNYGNVFWTHIVESKGDGKVSSDMMLLLMNLVKFMGRSGMTHSELGSYEPSTEKTVKFPAEVYWDDLKFGGYDGEPVMGVFGAHTSYSDGSSTVAEYVAAAKKAGLSFIVFADDVRLMDNAKTEALKADCKASSNDAFLALPGLEFQDSTGLHRYVYGSNIKFPYEKPYKYQGREYPIMKDGRIDQAGYFIYGVCSASQNLFLDSSEFEKCHTHPENLWWFWSFAPWYFDGRNLVRDNRAQGRAFLHDLRLISPVSFTRMLSASDVQAAKETSMTGGRSLAQIERLLNYRSSSYWAAKDAREFVTRGNTGIRIIEFQGLNEQEDPKRLHTRGTQRARVHFKVRSPAGLKEIRVMDTDAGVFRRFQCGGVKEFSQTVEFVHDRQHHLFLEGEDNGGGEAISTIIFAYDYKQGLFRCSDNMNILGPLGIIWHPNWPEKLQIYKYFRNSELYSVMGWDRGAADCPKPRLFQTGDLYTSEGEAYPFNNEEHDGVLMNTRLTGGDMQIVEARMDERVERFGNTRRSATSSNSPTRVLSKNEYLCHEQKIFYFRDRQDFYIAWEKRRLKESLEEYDGSATLVTGKVTFRKDVTLKQDANVPFSIARLGVDPAVPLDGVCIVKDKAQGILSRACARDGKPQLSGAVADEGFLTLHAVKYGENVVVPLHCNAEWRYCFGNSTRIEFGIGAPGQHFKAGDVLEYSFLSLDVINDMEDIEHLEELASLWRGGYKTEIKVGTEKGREVFYHAAAQDGEALFELGPLYTGIDHPFRIDGLDDNGCVAIYTSLRPWFRFVGIADGTDTAFFQESVDAKNLIWCGNVFSASDKRLRLTLVWDGQRPGANPKLVIHNPTDENITATITSPKNTPHFGGMEFGVEVSAGSSTEKVFSFK